MKCVLIGLAVIIAVASAGILAPSVYSVGPYGYAAPYAAAPYAAAPYAAYASPVAVAPSGYVAATRGSLHVAPLPQGPFASSLNINTAPAPGTF